MAVPEVEELTVLSTALLDILHPMPWEEVEVEMEVEVMEVFGRWVAAEVDSGPRLRMAEEEVVLVVFDRPVVVDLVRIFRSLFPDRNVVLASLVVEALQIIMMVEAMPNSLLDPFQILLGSKIFSPCLKNMEM